MRAVLHKIPGIKIILTIDTLDDFNEIDLKHLKRELSIHIKSTSTDMQPALVHTGKSPLLQYFLHQFNNAIYQLGISLPGNLNHRLLTLRGLASPVWKSIRNCPLNRVTRMLC